MWWPVIDDGLHRNGFWFESIQFKGYSIKIFSLLFVSLFYRTHKLSIAWIGGTQPNFSKFDDNFFPSSLAITKVNWFLSSPKHNKSLLWLSKFEFSPFGKISHETVFFSFEMSIINEFSHCFFLEVKLKSPDKAKVFVFVRKFFCSAFKWVYLKS